MVNARHTKNLPGRKSDVQECQWLMKLHTYGLLNNSFRPSEEICVLRTYWRQQDQPIKSASATIQRIPKVLTERNVPWANVISDISGLTGMAILDAILHGERDRYRLCRAGPSAESSQPESRSPRAWKEIGGRSCGSFCGNNGISSAIIRSTSGNARKPSRSS